MSEFVFRVKTMFKRDGNGRNFCGIDSHVLRPIITAFCFLSSFVVVVVSLKNFKSSAHRHGMEPFVFVDSAYLGKEDLLDVPLAPIPKSRTVVATIKETDLMIEQKVF